MKIVNNPHNRFNQDSYALRRMKFILAKKMLKKGEHIIPLLRNGTIAPVEDKKAPTDESILQKWFFEYSYDIGIKIKEKLFHLKTKHEEEKFNLSTSINFRLYEVKNDSL